MHRGDDPLVRDPGLVLGLRRGGGAFEQAVAGLVLGQDRRPQAADRVPAAVISAAARRAQRVASISCSGVTPGR